MRTRNLFVSTLIASLLIIATTSMARFYNEGAFQTWRPLGSPPTSPDKIVEIVQVDFDQNSIASIYLISKTNGNVYRGSRALCAGKTCWNQVNLTPEETVLSDLIVDKQCHSSFERMQLPSASVELCASYSDEAAGSHLLREAHFLLLEEGNFFVWQFIPGSGALLIMLIGSSLTLLGSAISYFVLSGRTRKIEDRASQQ